MKINSTTKITGDKVILVPYRKHHVEKYNKWMSLKEIQELTSSEPLTLEEEYKMQKGWQEDEDKLTFIVLRRDLYDSSTGNDTEKELLSMVGDVNVFLYEDENGPENEKNQAELEVMIVEKEERGKGFGAEAIISIINYSYKNLPILKNFFVKIDDYNKPSIGLFEKLGFVQYEYVKAFKQASLRLPINDLTFPEKRNIEKKYAFGKDVVLNINSNY